MASAPSDRRQRVAQLAEQLRGWESAEAGRSQQGMSSGCSQLDALLPAGGFSPGSLVEWFATDPGAGATTLALAVARAACGDEGWLVVIDSAGTFYPPAAAALGAPLRRMIWVRRPAGNVARWATDQALRCPGVAAVLAWPETLDATTFRRWQLAVEQSRVLGLLVRPAAALKEPSWAEARLLVEPRPSADEFRRWQVELLHARGGWGGRSAHLGIHHDTGQWFTDRIAGPGGSAACALRVVPRLAPATLVASPTAG
ncbi:MAG: hypothetical protein SGJ19_04275 [Planctomycetia bacterium]|nr:hypothetical protein [Planctomycetia bacterium]